jgi:hypothetical protein
VASDERDRRIGLNEAAFRAANERIEEMNLALGQVSEEIMVVCECGNPECLEQIALSLREYEEIRSDPTHFVVVPGHGEPSVDTVVSDQEGYSVVRKDDPDAREVVERTDPRG